MGGGGGWGLLAYSVCTEDFDELQAAFKALDESHSGTITVNQLSKALQEQLNMSEKEAEKVFRFLDHTGNEEISYSDFLSAAMMSRVQLNENQIWAAFQKLDIEGTGEITLDNLKEVFGEEYGGETVQDIVKSFGQGETISYAAFSDALVRKVSFAGGVGTGTDGIIRQISKQLLDAAAGGAPNRQFEIPNFEDDNL